jgi:hypothetical protein
VSPKIHFEGFIEAKNEVQAVTKDLDHARLTESLERLIKGLGGEDLQAGECVVDEMGKYHANELQCCQTAYDKSLHPYCKVQHLKTLERRKDGYIWLPAMLKFYWQNGIGRTVLRAKLLSF